MQNLQPDSLSRQQKSILPVAAFATAGDIPKLRSALTEGLNKGLSVSDAQEVLIQLYAYAGFPRSLNALSELMKLLDTRRQKGISDQPGRLPSRAIPEGNELRTAGIANQTRLVGQAVRGPLFEFAPIIGEYLQSHLFGAIFERDNLDWNNRELATVGMLSALPGAETQLQSHLRYSLNVGLTMEQLQESILILENACDGFGKRAREALSRVLEVPNR